MNKAAIILVMLIMILFIIFAVSSIRPEKYTSPFDSPLICEAADFYGCGENAFVLKAGDTMTGNLTFTEGQQPYYNVTKEIVMPLGRFKLPGVNPPEEAIISISPTLKFDKNTNESVYTNMHVPSDYNETSEWNIEIVWFPDDKLVGNVIWCTEFIGPMTSNVGETINGTTNTYCIIDASNGKYELQTTNKISVPGTITYDHDSFSFRLFRGADDPSDTFDADADLFIVTVNYQSNKAGESS